ncbi:nucleotidyl transferase AbiEii/AbiGii toxin family protein [Rudaea cellulosilytica]|uniref:nucleotidyl transferase AbiEii/AbiGii toxin family protein n=1 Tax=Rudaea cellulosilytica TaxID=540746 RepID=UPI00035DCD28|nr:nucleotidyl transferase AbiEii/AbiGii toxin family protein [Rudaea cellulosilytica]
MKDTPYFEQARLLLRYLPALSSVDCFALKGGTAINLFVRDLPRLSVDIDLAFLPLTPRDDALAEATDALVKIAAHAQRLVPGLKVVDAGNADRPKQLALTEQARIKIEPNPVLRGTVFPVETRRLMPAAEDLFELSVSVPVVSFADLYAGKFCAALDRQHPRDWFDIALLLDNEGIDEPLRQAFVVYLASHHRPMAELLAPRAKSLRATFDTEFAGMPREPIAVEILEGVQAAFPGQLLSNLSANERRFLLSIKRGDPDWSLLPIPHLSELPALRWKLANIERMKQSAARHRQAVDKLRTILEI